MEVLSDTSIAIRKKHRNMRLGNISNLYVKQLYTK